MNKIVKLGVENFMSIKKATISLDNKGLVLVQGDNQSSEGFDSNGAGKSTLFTEAPTWCLFGETIRTGYKGDKVINRQVGKNCMVFVDIESNDDLYTIARYRKHKEHKNHVLLYRNGQNITSKSDKDTNQAIIDLLGIDYLSFTNSIMFGQGLSKMFANSTDKEQKQILEQMLQIDIYKACQDLAKDYVQQSQQRITDLEHEMEIRNEKRMEIEENIADLQEKEDKLAKEMTQKIQVLENEIVDLNNSINSLEDTTAMEKDMEDLEKLITKVSKKIDSYNAYEEVMLENLSEQKSLQSFIKKEKKEIDSLEKKLKGVQDGSSIPKICDSCGQDLPLEDTSKIEKHLKDDIEKRLKAIEKEERELEVLAEMIAEDREKVKEKEEYEESRDELKDEIYSIKRDIDKVKSNRESYNKEIKVNEKMIDRYKEMSKETYTDSIDKLVTKVEDIKKKIKVSKEEMEDAEYDKEQYEFWVNGFGNGGIKSVLLDDVTPFLNKRANYYLSKLAGSSIKVQFNTQTTLKSGEKRDKFSVEVTNEHGDDAYNGNSSGERRRVDIAINMALQDLVSSRSNKKLDLVVFDEVYDGLDEIGCESAISLLKEKAQTYGSVIVITHNDHLKQQFSKQLLVTKTPDKTVVTEQEG